LPLRHQFDVSTTIELISGKEEGFRMIVDSPEIRRGKRIHGQSRTA
jgi:hypothetical protein